MTEILYTDDGQWWYEGDAELYIKHMDVPEADWELFDEGKLTMQDLIDRHGDE